MGREPSEHTMKFTRTITITTIERQVVKVAVVPCGSRESAAETTRPLTAERAQAQPEPPTSAKPEQQEKERKK